MFVMTDTSSCPNTRINQFAQDHLCDKKLVIPNWITDIPVGAFNGMECESVVFHDKITVIRDSAFKHCINLKNVVLPDSVKFIGDSVFEDCYKLKSIIMPDNVAFVGEKVFTNCSNLSSVKLPGNLKVITYKMFGGCKSLEDIDIPESVSRIEERAFAYSGLKNVFLLDNIGFIGHKAFAHCINLREIIVPGSVSSVGSGAFCSCRKLESATFDYYTEVPEDCFANCDDLKIFTGHYVTRVGNRAFNDCVKLKSVEIEDNFKTHEIHDIIIGDSAFSRCIALTEFNFAFGLSKIGDRAFLGSGLSDIQLPKTLVEIGAQAFMMCHELRRVDFSICMNLQNIGASAFEGNDKLITVYMPDELKYACILGSCAFRDCGIRGISMPEGVVLDINGRQFEDCRELSDVKLLDDEMFVPDMCFCGCVELDDSWIGESVNPPPLIEAGVSLLKIDE